MKYYTIATYIEDWHGNKSEYMDVRIYRADEVPFEKVKDAFFHLLLCRSKKYESPKHLDIVLPDDPGLMIRAVARFRDCSSLWSFLQEESAEELESGCLDNPRKLRWIPHYGIDMTSGCRFIVEGEYNKKNYIAYLKKFLKGKVI